MAEKCKCEEDDLGDVTLFARGPVTIDAGKAEVQFLSFCRPGDKEETVVRVILEGPPPNPHDPKAPKSKTYSSADIAKKTVEALNATQVIPVAFPISSLPEATVLRDVCSFDDAMPNEYVRPESGEGGGPINQPIKWTKCWWRISFKGKVRKRVDPRQAGDAPDEPTTKIFGPGPGVPRSIGELVHEGIEMEVLGWPSSPSGAPVFLQLAAMGGYEEPAWIDAVTLSLRSGDSQGGTARDAIVRELRVLGWKAEAHGVNAVRISGREGEPIVSLSWFVFGRGSLAGLHLEVRRFSVMSGQGTGPRTAVGLERPRISPAVGIRGMAVVSPEVPGTHLSAPPVRSAPSGVASDQAKGLME